MEDRIGRTLPLLPTDIASDVLAVLAKPMKEHGIELDVRRVEPNSHPHTWPYLIACAKLGDREVTHVWVKKTEDNLRKTLRESVEELLDDIRRAALDDIDAALDGWDDHRANGGA
jgi:hypothetical protein